MLTAVKNQLKVCRLSMKYSIMREMINTKTFLFSTILMFISNASFLVQWTIIISVTKDPSITMKQILLVWGFAAVGFGFQELFFSGVNAIPSFIVEGKLDAYLVQPKNVLLSVATSKSSMPAIGDIAYGLVALMLAVPSVSTFFYALLFSILGGIVYASFSVIVSSTLFFSIEFRELVETIKRIPVGFATYPETIFHGVTKVLFYTVLPIAYIVYMPVRFMLTNNYLLLLYILLFTIFIAALAFGIFNIGLKRYSSANLMGARV